MRLLIWALILVCPFFSFSQTAIDSSSIEGYIAANEIEAKESPDGIFYAFDKKGKGKLPKSGDYVKLKYVGKMLNGTVFDQSEKDHSFVFRVGYREVILGWDKGIVFLPVGSKAKMFIPAELAYGKKGLGSIPGNTPLLFEMEIEEVLSQAAYDKYMMEEDKKRRENYEKEKEKQFTEDKRLINDYARSKKLRVQRTKKGTSYIVEKKGKGENLKRTDKVKIHYEGFLLDGTKFDSSRDRRKPFEFILGIGKVIEGWDDALVHFKKGSKGWILIPSKLAYGRRAIKEKDIHIPANSVLAFKIEVVDVKPRK